MKGRVIISITVAAAICASAVPAFAGIGSVVSSFKMDGARNIYRDASYVYCVVGTNTLRRYNVSGSLVGTVALAGLTDAGDADHSPWGAGYLGVIEKGDRIFHYRIPSGSLVMSIPTHTGTLGYAYFPGGAYVYYHVGPAVHRYTTMGSFVSSFAVDYSATAIAATNRFNDKAGEYVIVGHRSSGSTIVFTGAGSKVTNFTVPGAPFGCVCGPGSAHPLKTPFTTYWCVLAVGSERFAYDIDIGNRNVSVKPASFGKIKGLYR